MNNKILTVYSNTGCNKCAMLKKWLEMKDIKYNELNISEDVSALNKLKENGLRSLPQVEIGGDFIQFNEYNEILEILERDSAYE